MKGRERNKKGDERMSERGRKGEASKKEQKENMKEGGSVAGSQTRGDYIRVSSSTITTTS